MSALIEAAAEVSGFMHSRGWRFCIIGGLAVQRWGEPRTTLDAHFTLLTGWGDEAPYVQALLARFESRLEDAEAFALSRRILLLRASNGKDIDIALGALPFEEEMIARAVTAAFEPGIDLPVCSAEDLFIMKAFAGRARDRLDAEGIVARNPGLDRTYIARHLSDLAALQESPEKFLWAERLLEKSS